MPDKIRRLREGHEMSQHDLAQLCGVATPTVSKWERGITVPRLSMLHKLADIFRVDVSYFTSGEPTEHGFYYNKEIVNLAQELFENPGRRILFDASKKLSKEAMEEVKHFIEYQLAREGKKL